ncbi:hypothetical protein ASE93_23480 [Serratia sp. Leaf50]|nr:hypothetical protein ASE93_23480 [Serratia sp. Leaf50]
MVSLQGPAEFARQVQRREKAGVRKGQATRAAHRAEVKRSAEGAGPEASVIAPGGARRFAARCAARLNGPKGDAQVVDVVVFFNDLTERRAAGMTPCLTHVERRKISILRGA